MLNKKGQRELAYVVQIDKIEPIEGRDRVECAWVGGWSIMVRKGVFNVGDLGIYFEIDSKTPPTEPFEFLQSKHYKIKTQKYKTPSGQFWSQGLLMSAEDFGWTSYEDCIVDDKNIVHLLADESRFLTSKLNIVYAVAEDNVRKTFDKYNKMLQKNKKLFSKQPYKYLITKNWGKKLLYIFYGDKKNGKAWPAHIAKKTDVERIQNMIYVLNDKKPYVATEKIDGSSCSIMAERKKFGKINQYICSRNVVFKKPEDNCYYDTNIYFEVYNKYNLGEKTTTILKDLQLSNIALQMEVYGDGVQKRDYSTKEHKIAIFHIVSNGIKFPMEKTIEICEKYDLPHVPIVDYNYILPDTIEELQEFVEKDGSAIDGLQKEGIVFYDKETGQQYFKFVSPDFLMKYH